MRRVLIIGAGQIGSIIAFLLARSNDYHVYLADITHDNENVARLPKKKNLEICHLNITNDAQTDAFLTKNPVDAIISSLPFFANIPAANAAKRFNTHYFDLTEDIATTNTVMTLAKGSKKAFVPQCGLAPGFISIVAHHLIQRFPASIDAVRMRVGALPINISNALQYSLTWSVDGLINEYGNLCQAIENGEITQLSPLDDLEEIKIDGLTYEAFNTSGGIGSLVKTYANKVNHLSYKTIRYPGHCNKMRFLMNDLQLNHDRETLKRILENAIPKTYQDVVLIYVSITGAQSNQYLEENYVKKFYPQTIDNLRWSAIQMTTASSVCATLDTVFHHEDQYQGFIPQEQFSFDELLANRFGKYYA